MTVATGQFKVSGGEILDPDNKEFVARGINVFLGQADAATIMQTFPGINTVRLATEPGANLASIDSLVQGLTSQHVVVEIEDHTSSGGNPNTLSGQALTNECNWYAQLASKYQNNPYVWFGTANEPDNTANLQAIPAQESAIYGAVRGAGSQAMILLEMRGGFTNDAARQYASTYASMTGVAWDTHFYGWVPNYSTSVTAIADSLKSQIADARSVKSADGIVPVIVGEYGPSTTGSGAYDVNGLQVVQAVQNSGYGSMAWAWSAGTDALTTGGTGLTDFGQLTAKYIASSALAQAAASTPTASPAVTIGSGPNALILHLSEDAWMGDAQFSVSVDGVQVGGPQAVTALHSQGQSEAFSFADTFGAGTHQVAVTFLNDAYGGTPATDRNLYVDGITLDGAASPGATATLYSSGTQTFSVSAATAAPTAAAPVSPDTLVLHLSEDAWMGDAQFVASGDGKQLGAAQAGTALHGTGGGGEAFTFTGPFGAGAHDLAVTFLNDAYGGTPTTDRNLYVNSATLDGSQQANVTAVLYSSGTTHFQVVVPSA